MIGQPQLQPLGGGLFVQPVPARTSKFEVDAEVKRHAIHQHIGQARRQLKRELGVEHQPVLDRAQARRAHFDFVGVRRGRGEGCQCRDEPDE